MITLLLAVHIGAAILFIGPATLATSLFARYAASATHDVAQAMHSISRRYGTASAVVGIAGFALAAQLKLLGQGWLLLAIVLFVAALIILGGIVIPAQSRALDAIETGAEVPEQLRTALRAASGLYAVTWVVILVLMVAKPF